jgi:hypothetical protein
MDKIRGVEIAVLDALRPKPHPTHMCLDEGADGGAAHRGVVFGLKADLRFHAPSRTITTTTKSSQAELPPGVRHVPESQIYGFSLTTNEIISRDEFRDSLQKPLAEKLVENGARLTPTNGILLVARLDGPTAEIASQLVDKALTAERDGLWGRAYFDARGLKNTDTYFLGDRWILTGAEICRQLGFDVCTDTNAATFPASFPMSQIAIYAGWYDSDVSGPFTLPKVEFMPGAFAYHLHSFSAATIRNANQNWVGPLLAKGATCTMGCVYEPYLATTPNVAFFLQALGNGYTFGEAAWAAQPVLSWQTTVVGDPLYCPFGKPPLQQHAELAERHSPLIEWSFLRFINLDIVRGVPIAKLANFVENLPATATSAVLTEKFADFCEQQGKPSSAIDAYENALALNPTPQQRIRLRLTLADELLAQSRDADATDDYKRLLAESPDYPGKTFILEKLAALEQKSGKATNVTIIKR